MWFILSLLIHHKKHRIVLSVVRGFIQWSLYVYNRKHTDKTTIVGFIWFYLGVVVYSTGCHGFRSGFLLWLLYYQLGPRDLT